MSMLTTTDNPYDPNVQYDEWLAYDELMGYYTNEYLARVCITSHDLSDADQAQDIEDAIDEIIRVNPLGIYKKV